MKFLSVLSLLFYSILTNAQVLDNPTVASRHLETSLRTNGDIIWLQHNTSFENPKGVIKFYNEDFSYLKEVDLSTLGYGNEYTVSRTASTTSNALSSKLRFICSDKLFNADDKLEFVLYVYKSTQTSGTWGNTIEESFYLIVNEDGEVLQKIDRETEGAEQGQARLYEKANGVIVLGLDMNSTESNYYELAGKFDHGVVTNLDLSSVQNIASLYPNPAQDYIKLDYEMPEGLQKVELKIYDMNGQVLKSMVVDGLTGFVLVDINEFENGNYILKTMNGEELITSSQFVVMK